MIKICKNEYHDFDKKYLVYKNFWFWDAYWFSIVSLTEKFA